MSLKIWSFLEFISSLWLYILFDVVITQHTVGQAGSHCTVLSTFYCTVLSSTIVQTVKSGRNPGTYNQRIL